jgi:hypothetical protein
MPKPHGFFDYVRAAFSARPIGMFVPPNWVGLGAFALLGVANPGFWVLGAGLELGYLAVLATNQRFQRVVDAVDASGSDREWRAKIDGLVARLGDRERRRYQTLSTRCQTVLDQLAQGGSVPHGLREHDEGLGRLLWMYLRLLVARQAVVRVVEDADTSQRGSSLERRLQDLESDLGAPGVSDDLRRSLTSQADILRQRLAQQTEARGKQAFLDAELTRIEEQVELIREQAALSTDPELLSQRIDEIVATLGGTSQWIRDQQQMYGAMEDLLSDAPPVATATPGSRARESQ